MRVFLLQKVSSLKLEARLLEESERRGLREIELGLLQKLLEVLDLPKLDTQHLLRGGKCCLAKVEQRKFLVVCKCGCMFF